MVHPLNGPALLSRFYPVPLSHHFYLAVSRPLPFGAGLIHRIELNLFGLFKFLKSLEPLCTARVGIPSLRLVLIKLLAVSCHEARLNSFFLEDLWALQIRFCPIHGGLEESRLRPGDGLVEFFQSLAPSFPLPRFRFHPALVQRRWPALNCVNRHGLLPEKEQLRTLVDQL